jgi:hypothetical protein
LSARLISTAHCAGRFRVGVKDQHHPIASWDPNQTLRGFGLLKLFGGANNPVQFLNRPVLVVNRKLRVANDVDEQDMGDFELDLFLNLRRHVLMRVASTPEAIIQILPCPVEEIDIENHTSRRVARYQPARREERVSAVAFCSRQAYLFA